MTSAFNGTGEVMDTDKLLQAINKLNLFLVNRRYYEDCECRDCDEARSVAEARELLITFHTQVVQGEAAPSPSKAQASPEAVAAGARALAVQIDGMKFNLYGEDQLIMAGYVHEIVAWAMKNAVVIEFRYR